MSRYGFSPDNILTEANPRYGNPNLMGPQGEPWEEIYVTDGDNEAWIQNHSNGHTFTDVDPPVSFGPHYHGPPSFPGHIFYP